MKKFFLNRIIVDISGKNVLRFIMKINKKKINIYKIIKKDNNNYKIIINYSDFENILKLNTIYKIKIEKYLGIEQRKKQFLKYYHIIISFIFCIIIILFLSNIIFKIEIVTNDVEVKNKLLSTLEEYGIKKYKFKKNYNEIQMIKEKIIDKYNDEIQWLEIERMGTKYLIKYEPRIKKKDNESIKYQHITAKKNATILKIYSSEGQIIKNKNSYVKKGDIIISGYIYLNDKLHKTVKASGSVYGQTWYIIQVKYPFNYYETKKTGRKKNVFSLKILNNSFDVFNFDKFDDKIIYEDVLLKNKLLPISFVKQKQEEIVVKTSIDDVEQVKLNAIKLAYEKINSSLKDDEYIINHKVLNSIITNEGVTLEVFFSLCENIGEFVEIKEMKEVE